MVELVSTAPCAGAVIDGEDDGAETWIVNWRWEYGPQFASPHPLPHERMLNVKLPTGRLMSASVEVPPLICPVNTMLFELFRITISNPPAAGSACH